MLALRQQIKHLRNRAIARALTFLVFFKNKLIIKKLNLKKNTRLSGDRRAVQLVPLPLEEFFLKCQCPCIICAVQSLYNVCKYPPPHHM